MAKKKGSKKDSSQILEWAREFGAEVLNIRDTVDTIIQAFICGEPLMLVGDTGQGKSDAIYQAYYRLKEMARAGQLMHRLGVSTSSPILRNAYEPAREERELEGITSESVEFEYHCWVPATADAFDYRGLPAIKPDGQTQYYTRPEEIPSNPHGMGIINVREMNRPAAARTVKPLIEMMESRTLGPHVIPEGYRIVGDINVGDVYDTHDILSPFFNRRVTWVVVRNTPEDFIDYMYKKYPGSIVASFIEENPAAFDNHAGRVNNQIYGCAAVWERVQQIVDSLYPEYTVQSFRPLLSGKIRQEYAARFMDYLQRGMELSPRRILEDYSRMQKAVLSHIEEGSGADLVATAALASLRILKNLEPDDETLEHKLKNFTKFFCDLPLEVAQNTALDLAPEAAKELEETATSYIPETLEIIQEHLMFNSEARERLSQLNTIITKRTPDSEEG